VTDGLLGLSHLACLDDTVATRSHTVGIHGCFGKRSVSAISVATSLRRSAFPGRAGTLETAALWAPLSRISWSGTPWSRGGAT
jgi:hypothetical protein